MPLQLPGSTNQNERNVKVCDTEDVFDKEMQFDSGFAALIAAVAFKYEFWDQLQFR